MGLASLLTRSLPPNPPAPPRPRQYDGEPGGPFVPRVLPSAVTERTALSVPAFWRGHAIVCGGFGQLPAASWRGIDKVDPQPSVIRQPDPSQTPMAFWAGILSALTLYGNSVCICTSAMRDRLGYPNLLKPVHPLNATVRLVGNPRDPDIGGWYLDGQPYGPEDVWFVRSYLGRAGWPLGIGLLEAVTEGISKVQSLQDYRASYFAGGAIPTGVIKIHRPEVPQEEADRVKAEWTGKFAGRAAPAVLNDLVDFVPVASRPVDSQMIEAAQMDLLEVALMWGLPPSKLGSSVAGAGAYRNVESEERISRNDAVAPWVRLIEQAATFDLVPRGQEVRWDLDAYLRADTATRFAAYQQALGGPGPQSAWMLRDEVREIEHLEPLGEVAATDTGVGGDVLPTPAAGVAPDATSSSNAPAATATPASVASTNGAHL